jgi:hypothetical protein
MLHYQNNAGFYLGDSRNKTEITLLEGLEVKVVYVSLTHRQVSCLSVCLSVYLSVCLFGSTLLVCLLVCPYPPIPEYIIIIQEAEIDVSIIFGVC